MTMSLPSWERGLKYHHLRAEECFLRVAPLVGARIEIFRIPADWTIRIVAPLVGARIEIILIVMFGYLVFVAPLVGARIEIELSNNTSQKVLCRSPRGSAD